MAKGHGTLGDENSVVCFSVAGNSSTRAFISRIMNLLCVSCFRELVESNNLGGSSGMRPNG